MKIELSASPQNTNGAEAIRNALIAYNHEMSGGTDFENLQLLLRDPEGEVVGGLLAWTVWSWMHIDSLWVHDGHRQQGWGTQLLREAEAEAIKRGCVLAEVDTFNFQAKAFYEKAGYEIFGTLTGIGGGRIERYYFRKELC